MWCQGLLKYVIHSICCLWCMRTTHQCQLHMPKTERGETLAIILFTVICVECQWATISLLFLARVSWFSWQANLRGMHAACTQAWEAFLVLLMLGFWKFTPIHQLSLAICPGIQQLWLSYSGLSITNFILLLLFFTWSIQADQLPVIQKV